MRIDENGNVVMSKEQATHLISGWMTAVYDRGYPKATGDQYDSLNEFAKANGLTPDLMTEENILNPDFFVSDGD